MDCPQCGYHVNNDEYEDQPIDDPEDEKARSAWWEWCTKIGVPDYMPGLADGWRVKLFVWWRCKYRAGEDSRLEDVPLDVLSSRDRDSILTSELYRRQQIVAKIHDFNSASPTNTEKKTCNRHDDCVKADDWAKAGGRTQGADHCHDDECKDCFGD